MWLLQGHVQFSYWGDHGWGAEVSGIRRFWLGLLLSVSFIPHHIALFATTGVFVDVDDALNDGKKPMVWVIIFYS